MTKIAQSVSTEASPAVLLDSERCQFAFADGRQCRMPALCAAHARAQAAKKPGSAAEPVELIDLDPLSGEFTTATEINRALGKVFLLLAQGRIPRRNAVALGYIAQLMLQTLPRVREEIIEVCGEESWQKTLESAVCEEDTEDETNNTQADSGVESNPEKKNDRGESATHHTEEAVASPAEPAVLGAPISRLAGSGCTSSSRKLTAVCEPPSDSDAATVTYAIVGKTEASLGTPISVLAVFPASPGEEPRVPADPFNLPATNNRAHLSSPPVTKSPEPKSASFSSTADEEPIAGSISRAPGRLPSPAAQPATPAPLPSLAAESKYREPKINTAQQLFRNEHLHKKGGRGGNLLLPSRNEGRIWSGNGRPFRLPR